MQSNAPNLSADRGGGEIVGISAATFKIMAVGRMPRRQVPLAEFTPEGDDGGGGGDMQKRV